MPSQKPDTVEPTETITPAEAPADERIPFTVRLEPRHAQYLTDRAAMHGETPEVHLDRILRTFRAHHDMARPDHRPRAQEPGMPATTSRAR